MLWCSTTPKCCLPCFVAAGQPRGDDAPAVEISLTLLERLADGSWSALARPARRLAQRRYHRLAQAERRTSRHLG